MKKKCEWLGLLFIFLENLGLLRTVAQLQYFLNEFAVD